MCVFAIAAGPALAAANVLANVAVIGGVGSAALGGYSAYQQSKSQKAQAKYQAQVARNNAEVAEWKAEDALDRGRREEARYRLKISNFMGRQRSLLATSGFDANEDDAIDILADTAELGELDALTIRSNAEREAYTQRVNAQNATNQSILYDASAAGQSPLLAGATNVFGGAADVASKWYTFKS